ncbi:MAG: hypothetical protein C0625_17190 [Arcobacter sp.]|nr:MAG: hypothetical protein C0625_17190 [Arcobacter sp.]
MNKLIIASILISTSLVADVIWLEEAPMRMNWDKAMKYCEDKGAILPSKKVFQEIWYKNNRASDVEGFDLSVSYWTRDEVLDNKKYAAYPFYFVQGRDTWYYKADKYGVRCIKKAN